MRPDSGNHLPLPRIQQKTVRSSAPGVNTSRLESRFVFTILAVCSRSRGSVDVDQRLQITDLQV